MKVSHLRTPKLPGEESSRIDRNIAEREKEGQEDTNRQTFAGGATFVPDPTDPWVLDDHPVQ
jgi:hypothetical protein